MQLDAHFSKKKIWFILSDRASFSFIYLIKKNSNHKKAFFIVPANSIYFFLFEKKKNSHNNIPKIADENNKNIYINKIEKKRLVISCPQAKFDIIKR